MNKDGALCFFLNWSIVFFLYCFRRIYDMKYNVSEVQHSASDTNHRWAALPAGIVTGVNRQSLVGIPVFTKPIVDPFILMEKQHWIHAKCVYFLFFQRLQIKKYM